MKYAVNTTWKHSKPIDWDQMNKLLEEGMEEAPEGGITYWFEIDSHTHGSLSIFESKEAFDSHKKRVDERRKESTNSGIVMTSENVGLIKAEYSS